MWGCGVVVSRAAASSERPNASSISFEACPSSSPRRRGSFLSSEEKKHGLKCYFYKREIGSHIEGVSIYLSIYLSVCLSGWLAGCLPGWLAGCLPGWLAVYLSVCLSGWLAGCLPGWLAVCLSVWLSVCLSVCLSIHPSIQMDFMHAYMHTY